MTGWKISVISLWILVRIYLSLLKSQELCESAILFALTFADLYVNRGEMNGQYFINIRTISQNVHHPKAIKEVLEYVDNKTHDEESFTFQICGPMLVVLFSFGREEEGSSVLLIWNWQTGKLLAVNRSQHISFTHRLMCTRLVPEENAQYPPLRS